MLTLIKRTGGIDTSDANAGPYQILTGYSGYVDDERIEGIMPNRGAYTYSLPVNTSHNIPDGWHNGKGTITQSLATQDTVTIRPSTSPRLVCAADRWTIGNLWVEGDADLVAGNVKTGVTMFGVTGTYKGCVTTDATAGAAQVLTGYSIYGSAGTKIPGAMKNNGTTNHTLDVDGSFTIPAGWHNGNGKVTQSLSTQAGWTGTPGTGNILLCSASKWTTGDIWLAGNANLVAGNIKKGVTIFGVTGTFDLFGSGNSVDLLNSNFDPTGTVPTTWTTDVPSGSGAWKEGCWLYFRGSYNAKIGWSFDMSKLSGKNWWLYLDFGYLTTPFASASKHEAWVKRFYYYYKNPDKSYWQGYSIWQWPYDQLCKLSVRNGYAVWFGPDTSYNYTMYAGRCWITID